MEAIALSSLGQAVVIATISETSVHVLDLVQRIGSKEHPKVQSLLRRLDIDAQLESIEVLVRRLNNLDVAKMKGSVIQVCLGNVHKAIEGMKEILQKIESLMGSHNKKWLSSIRPTDYDSYLVRLEEEKKVLDRRLDILVKVLMLPTKTIQKKSSWKRFFSRSNKSKHKPYYQESESLAMNKAIKK